MVDVTADSVAEIYRKVEIKRKPADPYGGPAQYYAQYPNGARSDPDDLEKVREAIDKKIAFDTRGLK